MSEMPGIPPLLSSKLQATLLRCGPFQSDNSLRPLFIDSRISSWRNGLPSAGSTAARVQAVVEYLWLQSDASGENALVLLVQVLHDRISRGDACYGQLNALVTELKAILETATTTAPSPAPVERARTFTGADKRRLVEALLACPTVSNRNTRDTVVNDLSVDIKTNIQRSGVDRVDVSNIVTACLNYANGVQELIEAVRFYEGNSISMQKVDGLWKELQ